MRGQRRRRRRVAGAHHHRLAAGPRSRRQGADRARQPGRGRVAHLPRRVAGVRAVRARVRRRSTATTKGRCPRPLAARGRGARFLYVLPNFQNPSGRSIGAARRAGDRRQRAAVGLPIVEDNPYGELWFDAEPPPPIASLWREGTIYLGSFSKVLAPGLRLGYVDRAGRGSCPSCCRPSRPPTCTRRASTSAWCTRSSSDGFLREHVPTIRAPLQGAARRDAGGARRAPAAERAARLPLAGAGRRHVLLARAAEGVDAEALLPRAVERGVAFVPGRAVLCRRRR